MNNIIWFTSDSLYVTAHTDGTLTTLTPKEARTAGHALLEAANAVEARIEDEAGKVTLDDLKGGLQLVFMGSQPRTLIRYRGAAFKWAVIDEEFFVTNVFADSEAAIRALSANYRKV